MTTATKSIWETVKEGDTYQFEVADVNRTQFVRYAGGGGDFNPIHHDQTFAEASGNPTVFAMGMLNAGILSRIVSDYVGVENLRRYQVRFATRVWPGDTVTCRGKVTRKYTEGGQKMIEGEVTLVNQKGEVAIQGSFRAALPSRS